MHMSATEADLMKRAMIQVDKMLSTKFMGRADLVLQIHDSLIIECDNERLEYERDKHRNF